MYGRWRVSVKVEPRSTFTLTRGIPYIAILLTQVIVARVSTWKLRESGNKSELEKEECGKEKDDE